MPAMQETWVQSLGPEDPLAKGKATHSGLENSMDYIVHGVAKSQTRVTFTFFPIRNLIEPSWILFILHIFYKYMKQASEKYFL